jgi:hypothetical protein
MNILGKDVHRNTDSSICHTTVYWCHFLLLSSKHVVVWYNHKQAILTLLSVLLIRVCRQVIVVWTAPIYRNTSVT